MRSLGPAFVMNKWDAHWVKQKSNCLINLIWNNKTTGVIVFIFQVYWLGPIVGGCLAAILYEFIFNPYRNSQRRKGSIPDGGKAAAPLVYFIIERMCLTKKILFFFCLLTDASSIHSDEDNYDDVKSTVANYQSARSQHYDQYRPAISPGGPSNPISPSGELFSFLIVDFLLNNNKMEGVY